MDDYQPMRNALFLKIANDNVYNTSLILSSALEASGLRIEDLAKLSGHSESAIGIWKRGKGDIPFQKMNDCLNAMGFQIRFEEIK